MDRLPSFFTPRGSSALFRYPSREGAPKIGRMGSPEKPPIRSKASRTRASLMFNSAS